VLRLLVLARVSLHLLCRLGVYVALGPVAGVEVGAAAPDFVFVSLVSTLVIGLAGTRSWDRCVCCRGLDAGAAASGEVVFLLSVVS
jgi:hypothetical protein